MTVAAATATVDVKESSEFKSNRFNIDEMTASFKGRNGFLNQVGFATPKTLVGGDLIKDKIKLTASGSQRQAVVAEIDSQRIALTSGSDTTLVAPVIRSETLAITAGTVDGKGVDSAAQIRFLGVKESSSASAGKNSHSFAHETVRDGGYQQDSLQLPDIRLPTAVDGALAGQSTKLALSAPGGIVVGATSLAPTQREQAQAGGAGGGDAPGGVPYNLKEQARTLAQQPGLAWLGELAKRDDVDWQKIELASQSWDYKRAGLTPEGAAVVVIVVTILTWGAASSAGAAVAEGAGMTTGAVTSTGSAVLTTTGSAVAAATSAAVTTLASQAAVSLINNQGDIGKTLQDLGSKESVKQLVTSMLTAGITQGVTSAFNLSTGTQLANASFTDRFATYATKAAVSAGVQSAVYGTPLSETAKTALINSLAQSLTSQIGDWGKGSEVIVAKAVAHAVVQCAAASVQNKDCGSAALGAAVAEAISPLLDKLDDRTKAAGFQQSIGSSIAGMGAMLAASLTGKDPLTALNAAQMVDNYNRQLHPA